MPGNTPLITGVALMAKFEEPVCTITPIKDAWPKPSMLLYGIVLSGVPSVNFRTYRPSTLSPTTVSKKSVVVRIVGSPRRSLRESPGVTTGLFPSTRCAVVLLGRISKVSLPWLASGSPAGAP